MKTRRLNSARRQLKETDQGQQDMFKNVGRVYASKTQGLRWFAKLKKELR